MIESLRTIAAYSSELQMGIEVEKEHMDVYEYIKKFLAKHDLEMPLTMEEMAAMIAKGHLKELKDYYTRLNKMEKSHE